MQGNLRSMELNQVKKMLVFTKFKRNLKELIDSTNIKRDRFPNIEEKYPQIWSMFEEKYTKQ